MNANTSEVAAVRSVADIQPIDLVKRAVMNAHHRCIGMVPRWFAVGEAFGLGSTYAKQLCRAHGVDPDEQVRGIECDVSVTVSSGAECEVGSL